jgi:hypothetical protein
VQAQNVRRNRAEFDWDPRTAIVLGLELQPVSAALNAPDSLDAARVSRLKIRRRPRWLRRPGYQPRSIHSSRCGRSRPIVVGLPWPGKTSIWSGRMKSLRLMLSMIVGKLA